MVRAVPRRHRPAPLHRPPRAGLRRRRADRRRHHGLRRRNGRHRPPPRPRRPVPGTVLTAAIGTLDHRHPAVTAADLPEGTPGPGITVRYEESPFPAPALLLTVPPFTVSSSHDLLSLPDVFGLATVTDPSRGHFPGISAAPLAVGQAKQNALARFDAHGFEAAAVTAIAAAPGGAPPTTTHRARRVEVTFDPPFGFLTVHRPSGLVLTTGWISRPS
ncbi:serpin family protein [Actinomadura sp. J1-007]|uniref:serpin family protein n=1 Tax=Actinomadura sp. J1-007 TaxID=2661913 RepID=UPI0035CD16CB